MSDEAKTAAISAAAANAANVFVTANPSMTADAANAIAFIVPNTEIAIGIAMASIPANIRLDMLTRAVTSYVNNRVTTAHAQWLKKCEPWTRYEEAKAADPLQTAVKAPEGDKPEAPDYTAIAAAAREALYSGEVRRHGESKGRKPRETKDPLVAQVTQAVVRALFDSKKNTVPGYKWTDAVKEVGGDGIAYLKTQIAEKVAAGADEAVLNKAMEDRYMKPARVILGIDVPKTLKDAPDLF